MGNKQNRYSIYSRKGHPSVGSSNHYLNLPDNIRAIHTTNITQCYEKIPLEGNDNLHDALDFIIRKGFYHHNGSSRKHAIWVHINTESGLADKAKWDSKLPGSSC